MERFNTNTAAGHDPDFRRGESANDLWWGDPDWRGDRRATLGPVGNGPYYAVEVKSGALGTKGGPQTDKDARVIDVEGAPIAGLYAAGNVMASVMGMTYGGAGGTLARWHQEWCLVTALGSMPRAGWREATVLPDNTAPDGPGSARRP